MWKVMGRKLVIVGLWNVGLWDYGSGIVIVGLWNCGIVESYVVGLWNVTKTLRNTGILG